MFDAIFALPKDVRDKYDVSSMKSLISVGAPLHTSTKEKVLSFFESSELNEFYGATELGGAANLFPEDQKRKNRSVGLPMLGMDIKLLDDDGEEVKQGDAGAFYVKGITLCDEYYKRPEATEEAFKDEWLGLGDKQNPARSGHLQQRSQPMKCGAWRARATIRSDGAQRRRRKLLSNGSK